jgi:hypothetical protein
MRFLLIALVTLGGFPARAELSKADFDKLRQEVRPDPAATWRSIPWKTSVLAAQNMAAETGKPIFIWAMDGHPLGCT